MIATEFTQLELRSAYGPVFRKVSTAPPRDSRPEEIPVIDISTIYDGPGARAELAKSIKTAAEGTGFFYIKNHGIDEGTITNARKAAMKFFAQSHEEKLKVAKFKSKHYNGYAFPGMSHTNPTENKDNKQGFMWQYDPKFDPDEKDVSKIPEEVKAWFRGEDMVWDGTAHIPDFQRDTIVYWQSCLKLARTLSKVFAVCLDLPEDYFDPLTTYPGADGVYNYYPALTPEEMEKAGPNDVGIGSHTDLQCFTLLWQDDVGGLQVLSDTQWIKAAPIPGTFVVNIGDFLMRMSNDRFKSTVHRVYNRTTVDRLSMPFFFGFNFNEKCSVLPTCTDENNPPKYEPISCGEWCRLRFQKATSLKQYGQIDKDTVPITLKA